MYSINYVKSPQTWARSDAWKGKVSARSDPDREQQGRKEGGLHINDVT
jgi:hypothetical protein